MTILLFLGIGGAAFIKKEKARQEKKEEIVQAAPVVQAPKRKPDVVVPGDERPDRIERFFSKGADRFPIVETIVYSSKVPWLQGRPAWIVDYAAHYETSRHFIARSLNGRKDYFTQNIAPGETFNVFATGRKIEFYLLVDFATRTMDFYYLDLDRDERVFIKSYKVEIGKEDPLSPSGSLTPTGKYALGGKVAIYKPGVEHYFQNQKVEMIKVFGTRWLPFEDAIENCTDRAKGYGIHGVPCHFDREKGVLLEEERGVGGCSSDGCIRLQKDDVEELFAIVITKRTVVEIVKDKAGLVLPMATENSMEDL